MQVMLLEEFKRQVHVDVRTHFNECEVENLHAAAARADDYALSHKLSQGKNSRFSKRSNKPNKTERNSSENTESSGKSKSGSTNNSGNGTRPGGTSQCHLCIKHSMNFVLPYGTGQCHSCIKHSMNCVLP